MSQQQQDPILEQPPPPPDGGALPPPPPPPPPPEKPAWIALVAAVVPTLSAAFLHKHGTVSSLYMSALPFTNHAGAEPMSRSWLLRRNVDGSGRDTNCMYTYL